MIAAGIAAHPGRTMVGITGSVAVGKSVAAHEVATLVAGTGRTVSVVCTDGFLWPNEVLEQRGLTARKGFPESFDVEHLRYALSELAAGRAVTVPAYSHATYDVAAGEGTVLEPTEVVIVDGLHLTRFAADLLDLVVHLDAPTEVLEGWFVERLVGLFAEAEDDPSSFYTWAVGLDSAERDAVARSFWTGINLPNLVECIEPYRDRADVVISLAADHTVTAVTR